MSGIDLSLLSGAEALVKMHRIDADSETTSMRSAKDLKEMDDLFRRDLGCDSIRKRNVMQNAMGFSTRRNRYENDC